jgi:hypothetical protein
MATVREQHSRYPWQATDEIRCAGCNEPREIPFNSSTAATANRVFSAHQAAQLSPLLASQEAREAPARTPSDLPPKRKYVAKQRPRP